ncbi:hypothetical protein FIC_01023 [Flavobacteriaceae bacterium 3519-10]|nr:hypothetical protein FIC_01023 [Flavobacteriaceae bacterium 3519-10]
MVTSFNPLNFLMKIKNAVKRVIIIINNNIKMII